MFELRPYQREAVDAVLNQWDAGHKKTLVVLPTGTGKTCVFSKVVENQTRKGRRTLILAHRGELLEQAADKLKKVSGLDSVLEKAESSSLGSSCPVTVGSVQSLSRPERLEAFPEDYFNDIIVDEAHHCLSESYLRILQHFPRANVLGVTATPDRGDMKSLSRVFDSLAYEYTLPQAIKEGNLCPVKAQMIPLKLDIGNVGISSGDFSAGDIGFALEPYLEQIAKEMKHYCKGRKTVVFLPLVETSRRFCALLNENSLRAAEINGKSEDRAEILSDFENGKYDVLCNSMLLTEGWDCPSVDCVVILRPTKVRALYTQMVGRGMRLHPGKEHLLLLDFLWMTERHDLCRPSAIISKNADVASKIDRAISKSLDGIDLVAAEEQAERDVLAEREEALAKQLEEMRKRKAKLVDPLQYALSIVAEDLMNYTPSFEWEAAPPTRMQLEAIEKYGLSTTGIDCKGKASLILDRLIQRADKGLSSPKQIRCLERFGFRRVGTWSLHEASGMINQIADNGWYVPWGVNVATYTPQRWGTGKKIAQLKLIQSVENTP